MNWNAAESEALNSNKWLDKNNGHIKLEWYTFKTAWIIKFNDRKGIQTGVKDKDWLMSLDHN